MRVGAVALLWDFCKDRLARQAALKTIIWIDSKVTPSTQQTDALKAAILSGFSGASTSADDFVVGVYLPGTTMIFTTPSGRFTMELRPGAFNIPTLITVRGLPNTFRLTGFPEDQQPGPFWDIDATNSNTDNTVETHTLATPGTATIVTCFNSDGEGGHEEYSFPGGQWGHNPVGGGFEFVDEVAVPGNLLAELEDCNDPYGGGPLFRMGSSGGGPSGFAQLTWSSAGQHLARLARTLFLPAPLQAAMVGGRGPLAGAPTNLSPFGVVLPDCETYSSEDFCGD